MNKDIICDKDTSGGNTSYPSCWKGKVTKEVTIKYNRYGTETDVLHLCSDCAPVIINDAKMRGYKVTVKEI